MMVPPERLQWPFTMLLCPDHIDFDGYAVMVAVGSPWGWRISSLIDNTRRVQVELAHALRITVFHRRLAWWRFRSERLDKYSQHENGALLGQSFAAPLTVCLRLLGLSSYLQRPRCTGRSSGLLEPLPVATLPPKQISLRLCHPCRCSHC